MCCLDVALKIHRAKGRFELHEAREIGPLRKAPLQLFLKNAHEVDQLFLRKPVPIRSLLWQKLGSISSGWMRGVRFGFPPSRSCVDWGAKEIILAH